MKQWWNWRKREKELEKEMQHHLRMAETDRLARGSSLRDAQSAARREFGNAALVKDLARDAWGWRWMRDFFEDVRYGYRTLSQNLAFALIAIMTLALGIGANTAIFSMIDAALLRAIPVRDAHQLVLFKWKARAEPHHLDIASYGDCENDSRKTEAFGCSLSTPFFHEIQQKDDLFLKVAAFASVDRLSVSSNGVASVANRAEYTSGDYFETLGIKPALGRLINREDDAAGAPAVVILSYQYWRSQFGGARDVLGKTLELNRVPFTIVGVAEEPFDSLSPGNRIEFWIPLVTAAKLELPWDNRDVDHNYWWLVFVARLKADTKLGAAQAEVSTLFQNEATAGHGRFAALKAEDGPAIDLYPLAQGLTGARSNASGPLYAMMGVVGVVLLIACANVAGLLLARATSRHREMAVRFALGASKGRILRQLLTESLMLSCAGGILGVLFGAWCIAAIQNFIGSTMDGPLPFTATIDTQVLLFTAAVAILTGVLFGFAPALRGMRVDLTPALKEGTGSSAPMSRAKRGWFSAGNSLVVAQVALSIVVLAAAGLLVRTLQNLKDTYPGFDTRNVLTFSLDPTLIGYHTADTAHFYAELQNRLASLPGVTSVSYSWRALLGGGLWTTDFHLEGRPKDEQSDADVLPTGPDFFRTMRIPFRAGRAFTSADFARSQMLTELREKRDAEKAEKLKAGSNPADKLQERDLPPIPAIVNESFVRRYLPNINPIGHVFGTAAADPANDVEKSAGWEILGVVADAKYNRLRREVAPTIYIAHTGGKVTFSVRTQAAPEKFAPQVRAMVSQMDSKLPVFEVWTETQQIERQIFAERLAARLASFFGGLALLLACLGLYGLISYEVARRTREIGIRSALGADRGHVLRMILAEGMKLAILGAVLGVGLALLVTRAAKGMLFKVSAADPVTFVGVMLLLFAVTLIACLVPARRATRVDPVVALRYE